MKISTLEKWAASCGKVLWFKKLALNQFSFHVALSDLFIINYLDIYKMCRVPWRSVRVAEWFALPTSVHGVAGPNPAWGEILPKPKRRFIAQSLSCSSFHCLKVTEILLKGHKTLSHPSRVPWIKNNHMYGFLYLFTWHRQERFCPYH